MYKPCSIPSDQLLSFHRAVRFAAQGHARWVLSAAQATTDAEPLPRIVTVRAGGVSRHYAAADGAWIDEAVRDVVAGVFERVAPRSAPLPLA